MAAAGNRAPRHRASLAERVRRATVVVGGGLSLTTLCFLVLPFIQAITATPNADLMLRAADVASLPPPPSPPEPEPEKEDEPEEEPPELDEHSEPMDLAQMELALNAGVGDGWMGGDFAVKLNRMVAGKKEVDALFSEADLDQKPRAIYQPSPTLTAALRKKAPGKVSVVFEVDATGRVQSAIVQKSSDPVFEQPAIAAVKKWKFEPGKRNGKVVRFRMRVPLIFK
jgi:protein TonB